jgi:hypothetical protein
MRPLRLFRPLWIYAQTHDRLPDWLGITPCRSSYGLPAPPRQRSGGLGLRNPCCAAAVDRLFVGGHYGDPNLGYFGIQRGDRGGRGAYLRCAEIGMKNPAIADGADSPRHNPLY